MPVNLNQSSYQRLRVEHAERRRPIAFWVGAGLSQPAGLPTWGKLRDLLVHSAMEQAATLPPAEGEAKEIEIDKAANTENLWEAFQILKQEMGRTEFREEIRKIFGRTEDREIPPTYRAIWSLPGVRGILTLNIDEFVKKSHRRTRLTEDITSFIGKDAADYAHILSAGRPFIANLHGINDAQSSWIFTKEEISNLVNTPGYKEFISLVLGQMTVVFCGISADDRAAGGFLDALSKQGLDLGSHYWITDRTDSATQGWASQAGLSIIRYTPDTLPSGEKDHTPPLLAILDDLKAYISTDLPVGPLVPAVLPIKKIPPPNELIATDIDYIRATLSGHAKYLLEEEGAEAISSYEKFLKEYARCIHQAWWLTNDEPDNRFYGNTVVEQISSSPFSSVWRLHARNGEQLALKVLQIDKLSSGAEIDSFRRGIQSLNYLTKADVPGTPKLIAAFEIPTSLVMEFVEGSNLQEIANQRNFDPWKEGLCVMENVCRHLRFGHTLPQGVLHRDVRPSNIMLPHFHWQPDYFDEKVDKCDVKLLNYDMSWHANAKGKTISGSMEESGYYAPELINPDLGRSTLVDSYGVAMCLYYIFTRNRPPSGGCKSTDWCDLLNAGFRINARPSWRSASIRLRRLIARATSPDPSDRPMIDQIGAELGLIREALSGKITELPADFWAEELIAQSEQSEYQSDPSGTLFYREPRAGRKISVEGDIQNKKVILNFRNQALHSTNRSGIDRLWSDKLQSARDILSSSGWKVNTETRYGNMEILLSAECPTSILNKKFNDIMNGLTRGIKQIRIE